MRSVIRPVDNIRKEKWHSTCARTEQEHDLAPVLESALGGLIAADFFTSEVLCWKGLITFYTLFVIELRRVWCRCAARPSHPMANG